MMTSLSEGGREATPAGRRRDERRGKCQNTSMPHGACALWCADRAATKVLFYVCVMHALCALACASQHSSVAHSQVLAAAAASSITSIRSGLYGSMPQKARPTAVEALQKERPQPSSGESWRVALSSAYPQVTRVRFER